MYLNCMYFHTLCMYVQFVNCMFSMGALMTVPHQHCIHIMGTLEAVPHQHCIHIMCTLEAVPHQHCIHILGSVYVIEYISMQIQRPIACKIHPVAFHLHGTLCILLTTFNRTGGYLMLKASTFESIPESL
jgi:hypothetical protein